MTATKYAPPRSFGQIMKTLKPSQYTPWLPGDTGLIQKWVHEMIEHVAAHPTPLLPIIEEFKELIESNSVIYMLFNSMFEEVPPEYTYPKFRAGDSKIQKPKRVTGYVHMLELLNYITTLAPAFNQSSITGMPVHAILDWPMKTEKGKAAFLNPEVNAILKKLLDQWACFLGSPDSRTYLNDRESGWLGPSALEAMRQVSRGKSDWKFEDEFICDPTAPHHGFKSWDDFFTRRFRKNARPVSCLDDDSVIVNACESAPYRIVRNVEALSQFWIKGQPYSLKHMLDYDPLADQFVGGTVYQAFLSTFSYHRWHAPVSGRIVKTSLIPGTYFSELQSFNNIGQDPVFDASGGSLGYLTAIATRALVFIQADNEKIGLMCFVAVGMADVSTCELGVYDGQYVRKGQEIGMFHFGGSTYCLVFRPGVELAFDLDGTGNQLSLKAENTRLNSKLAIVL